MGNVRTTDDRSSVDAPATITNEPRDGAATSTPRGSTLGRYLVIEKIGEGGMGVVFRAYDPKLHREIALKRLHRDALSSRGEARLLREAQAMARLSHPNVVTIYDVERTDEGVVMAMEYAPGQTLAEWIATGTRSVREILERFDQAGRGLYAAHAAGLVHRDFKPGNAIVGPDGRVRVMDFGLARHDPGTSSHEPTASVDLHEHPAPAAPDLPGGESLEGGSLDEPLTRDGAIMGTPAYMAPEQHFGQTADARSDQYAFCVSLWGLLPRGSQPRVTTRLLVETLGIPRGCRLVASRRESTGVDGRRRRSSKILLEWTRATEPLRAPGKRANRHLASPTRTPRHRKQAS